MTGLGQSRRFGDVCDMFALPPTTAVMMQCRERQKGATTGPELTRAKRTSPEADDRTLSSYTLALSRWAAMGKANSVFVAYCAKAFLASVISAPRAASLACDTRPANGEPAT